MIRRRHPRRDFAELRPGHQGLGRVARRISRKRVSRGGPTT